MLGHRDFKASNGWLCKSKERNGISLKTTIGEAVINKQLLLHNETDLEQAAVDQEPPNEYKALRKQMLLNQQSLMWIYHENKEGQRNQQLSK
ncbi:hypothetical protein BpHYR1_035254 [Brachionus plicatilis]|uniref:HTH CENPB-type domain-containing protein n=1 Tax=Brachionus plicatilis TaxID=10195 RepID=A0A3M7QFL4_BRAPC|nr:hypothetical protein BpHYR1_035254 [Brachionus plicatilis]